MNRSVCFLSLCTSLLLAGCGGGVDDYPDMGTVYGTVTLDGNPLEGASVIFVPKAPGSRSSFGTTDSGGYYELAYSANMDGAKVGEHTVRISTFKSPDPNTPGDKGAKETLPNKYNSKTTLTKTVENSSNKFDFELTSDGEIDANDNVDPDYGDGN